MDKSLCASNYVSENMTIKTTIKTSRLFYPAHYSSMILTEFQAFGNMLQLPVSIYMYIVHVTYMSEIYIMKNL